MRLTVEIMLRGNNRVFTETIVHPTEAATWTDEDAAIVIKSVLRAMARAQSPEAAEPADVSLRGVNWIVQPAQGGSGGVVIAIEIHSASAVAGPVPLEAATLEALITKAAAAAGRPGLVH